MPRPRRSTSSLSLNEYLSATELETEFNFPVLRATQSRNSREYLPSPLVGPEFELPNRNTIIHSTQSNPVLPTLPLSLFNQNKPTVAEKKGKKSKAKKNAVLDEVSLDFSQDSVTNGSMEQTPEIEDGLSNTTCGTSGPSPSGAKTKKPQPGRPKKRKDDSRDDLLESLPKGTSKQNDLLESMRLMINKTVAEAVTSSNNSIRDEIHALKDMVDTQVGELKNSFNTQIQSLSEKETRHHVESNINVKEELDKISTKITSFDRVQSELATANNQLKSRLDNIDTISTKYRSEVNQKITTIEITEDRHYTIMETRYAELENKTRVLADNAKSNEVQSETWEARFHHMENVLEKTKEEIAGLKTEMGRAKKYQKIYQKYSPIWRPLRKSLRTFLQKPNHSSPISMKQPYQLRR